MESMDAAGDAVVTFVKNPLAQPKYLTAFGGFLAVLGTVLPWTHAGGYGYLGRQFTYPGFTLLPGRVIAASALLVILVAVFGRTRPGKANSPLAAGLVLVEFAAGCVGWLLAYFSCKDCGGLLPGFGNILSLSGLFLTLIFGLIPNPRQ